MLAEEGMSLLMNAMKSPDASLHAVHSTPEDYKLHRLTKGGIACDELKSGSAMSRIALESQARYGQFKLANILFAAELGRRYPRRMSVIIHPDVVKTPVLFQSDEFNNIFNDSGCWLDDTASAELFQGELNQLCCAAGASGE